MNKLYQQLTLLSSQLWGPFWEARCLGREQPGITIVYGGDIGDNDSHQQDLLHRFRNYNPKHKLYIKERFTDFLSTVLLILYIVDTCVLCSGCTAQWIVNLAGIDIGTSSGALDRSVHVATGDCLLSFKIIHYLFYRRGNPSNTQIQLGYSGLCLPLYNVHPLRISGD